MVTMREKIVKWFVWKLPPEMLLWAVIRGFADATSGENGNKDISDITYRDVYNSIIKKYHLPK